jgi:Zn-dependent protease with chaperone function
MTAKVKYYDGKSSLGHEAAIVLHDHALCITFIDQDGIEKMVIWEANLIHQSDFNAPEHATLKYGNFPYQVLEINQKETNEAIQAHFKDFAFTKSNYNSLKTKPFKMVIIGGGILATLLTLIYYFILPTIAEQAAANLPYKFEEELGDATVKQVLAFSTIDTIKSKQINLFFKALDFNPEHKIKIVVIKDKTVNAFAVPGGHIFVYEGIIAKMQSKEELAALLAHEYAHLKFKHSLKSVCRQLSSYLFLSVILSDVNGIVAILAQNADMLKNLHFSRGMEKEADAEGLKLLFQSNIDPKGMIHLFHRLEEASPDVAKHKVFEMVSTHPQTKDRIANISQEIKKSTFRVKEHITLETYWQRIK